MSHAMTHCCGWPKPASSSGPGGAATPCSNHGTCKGAGDRKGKGKCKCETGYIGKRCAKCGPLHYKEPVEGEVVNGSLPYVYVALARFHPVLMLEAFSTCACLIQSR